MCVHLATQHQMLQGIMEKHCLQEKDLAPEIQRIKTIIYPPSPEPEPVVKVKSEPVVQPEAETEDPDDPAPVTSARARSTVSRVATSTRVTPSVTRVVSQGVTQAMTMQVTMIMLTIMMTMMMMSMTMQRPRVERIMNCFMCKEKVTTLVFSTIIVNLSVILLGRQEHEQSAGHTLPHVCMCIRVFKQEKCKHNN